MKPQRDKRKEARLVNLTKSVIKENDNVKISTLLGEIGPNLYQYSEVQGKISKYYLRPIERS